ncbi:hypothetical protein SISSUDRAFT_1043964 [Sistotremastrum suecicum HHB10207 ss-3]|uniref:F-box domain-containing protein n=1 Tax=Sistotremastrum suecicum HHB10207 ss-3 TaxID=1314776 RepID=A0A166FH27_9AGAM|nr:hypothetical protein SISSUDRAFT_1043964 [Sistotremastrum suecicum HHB10207 ss-3]
MQPSLGRTNLPLEIVCEIVEEIVAGDISEHGPNSKAPWRDLDGVSRASKTLRSVAMRYWLQNLAIQEDTDWKFLARRSDLCQYVRQIRIMRYDAFLNLFHLFPLLKRTHLCFLTFSEHVCSRLDWLPPTLQELEIALPDITDTFILSTISTRFPRLKSLRLVHSRAWCSPRTPEVQ